MFLGGQQGKTFFNHKRNYESLEDLKLEPVDEKLRRHNSNFLRHVTRLNNRMSEGMLNYGRTG
jgi:hypothetical protein